MRNKSCGNGSKNCVAFRNVMRNGIAIGNPTKYTCLKHILKTRVILHNINLEVDSLYDAGLQLLYPLTGL